MKSVFSKSKLQNETKVFLPLLLLFFIINGTRRGGEKEKNSAKVHTSKATTER